jgi:phospholipid/cholesterol/gamma-HCH transport system ATP-binding protein
LRTIIGLNKPAAGSVEVFGRDVLHMNEDDRFELEKRWGVLFQDGALFSSITVAENIQITLRENLAMPEELSREIALSKIGLVGLPVDAAEKYPAQLSGGMRRRAALARALALDPELLFLDEPTSGLDPIGAGEFDELIATLQRTLGLTVFMVTHDLDTLHTVCDRIAVLADHKVIATGDMETMLASRHPWLRAYFHSKRSHAGQGSQPGARRPS